MASLNTLQWSIYDGYERTDPTWFELFWRYLKRRLGVPDMILSAITAVLHSKLQDGEIANTCDRTADQLLLITQIFSACHICSHEPGRTI